MWNHTKLKNLKLTNEHSNFHNHSFVNHTNAQPHHDNDPGRLHYRKHNIYLNFLETFGRLPPGKSVTIHQKALFIFWMSTIFFWSLMQLWKLKSILRSKQESKSNTKKDDDVEQNFETEVPMTTTRRQTNMVDQVIERKKSPSKQTSKHPDLDVNLRMAHSAPNTPSKRRDYLDSSAFDLNDPQESISLTDITVKATLYEAPKVENKIEEEILNFKNEKVNDIKEDSNDEDEGGDEELSASKQSLSTRMKSLVDEVLLSSDKDQPTFEKFLLKMTLFGCFLFYFFLTDYLHMWPKVEKQYSRDMFVFLFFWLVFAAIAFTLRKTKELRSCFTKKIIRQRPKVEKQYSRDMFVFLFFWLVFAAIVFTLRKTKEKLLNRDQTEEWKGWMQVQFVWYHYFDAQETFNSIRVYVGGYVWMTGFGNYIYFSTRKDYSIFRLLKMLFRLNFLVFCIMAVTNHEFVRYYICAMHTYWFLSVYAVMVVLNRYNSPALRRSKGFVFATNAMLTNIVNEKFILLKFVIYAIFNAMIFLIPGAMDKVFTPMKWALHDHEGSLRYWKYRAWLDHWSTLFGMFLAFNFERLEKFLKYLDKDDPKTRQQRETLRYTVTAFLLAIFAVWFYYVLRLQKHQYLDIHPFTSPIPITVYAILRNIHPVLRTYHLNLFTWLGKITLETYLSQIHLYMMGDAKAILVYLPQYPMLNFTLSTLIYVTVSYILFHLTVFFSSYIFPRNGYVVSKNILVGFIWLGSCYILAYILTLEHVWNSKNIGLEFLRWKVPKY